MASPSAWCRYTLFGALTVFLATSCPAQKKETATEAFIGEIIVEEKRPEERDFTVFPFFKIKPQAAHQTLSVADLLKWIPGVTVLETGSRAGLSSVLYRGTSSIQSRVFWNDVPLGLSYSGFTDLSEIPVDTVDSVTVGARLGEEWLFGSPPGAVISINATSAQTGAFALTSAGSFGFQKWLFSDSIGSFSFRLRSESEDGSFPFLSDNGTPYNPADDFIDRRRNNHFQQITVQLESGRVDTPLSAIFMRTREGVPGLFSVQAERPYIVRTRAIIQKHTRAPFRGWMPFIVYESQRFSDEYGEIAFLPTQTINQNWRAGFSFRSRESFVQSYADVWTARDLLNGKKMTFLKWVGHLGWSWSRGLRWKRAWLETSAGLQFEWRSSDAPEVQPLLGARIFWGPTRRTQFFGLRRTHRFPTFYERFGNSGTVIGNPALTPESGFTAEYGTVLVSPRSQSQFTAYASRMSRLIYYFQNSQRNFVAQNFARARFYGVEISHHRRLSSRSRLFAAVTYQRAIAANAGYISGRDLPHRPVWLASASFSQTFGTTEARLTASARYGGYYDTANLLPIHPRTTLDFSLAVPLRSLLRLSVVIRNISNEHTFDFLGYPLPGRSLQFSVSSFWGAPPSGESR